MFTSMCYNECFKWGDELKRKIEFRGLFGFSWKTTTTV